MARRYLYLETALIVMVMGIARIMRKPKGQPVRARTVLVAEDIIIIHISGRAVQALVLMVHMVLLHHHLTCLEMG
jgi:hypothetical protein